MEIKDDSSINGVLREDVYITNTSTFHFYGIIEGDVYVEKDSKFFHHGILNGNLTTDFNTVSFIEGTINGAILSSGGEIELSGKLNTESLVPISVVKVKGCYINGVRF